MNSCRLYSAEQVRQHEPSAAQAAGVSMFTLMQRAGQSTFTYLRKRWPKARRIIVAVGVGNNGGDGFIVAALALQAGLDVALCVVQPERAFAGDAKRAAEQWLELGGQCLAADDVDFDAADVIVDALLGTGLSGEVRAPFVDIIARINASSTPVLSIDIPSGTHADTGAPVGISVQANATITFVGVKLGLVTGLGRQLCGELVFNDLGIRETFRPLASSSARLLYFSDAPTLPPRLNNAHKGANGRVLCIGGGEGMPGAIRLTAEAALRSGAGLVKVYCHPHSQPSVAAGRPEVMVSADDLMQMIAWASCIIIGPGLGRSEWSERVVRETIDALKLADKPTLVDADGLNLLVKMKLSVPSSRLIVTPHPGEAARMLDCDISSVEQDRFRAVKDIADNFNATTVLKGAGSLISDGKDCWVCAEGNPGMATAGMGDVLSGVLGALIAQGMSLTDAALRGVCMHAAAGDLAAQQGQRGMIASDLFPYLRQLNN